MQRRDLLKMIAAATGTAFVANSALAYITPKKADLTDTDFAQNDVDFLNDVGEAIIPKTQTPGAKQANVGFTMAIIVSDCYSIAQQRTFKAGMEAIQAQSLVAYQTGFANLTADQKTSLLNDIDQQARQFNRRAELSSDDDSDVVPHYFTLIKQLTLFSFFTSQIGATQVLRHVAIPGSYNGELPYQKGDRAWSR